MKSLEQAFLWAFDLDPGGNCVAIDQQHLTSSLPQSGYRWVHLQSDEIDARELLASLGLPQSVADSLMAPQTRPRVLPVNQGALVFLRGINVNPGAEPDDMVSLRFWLSTDLIITTSRQHRELISVLDTRDSIVQGDIPASSAALFNTILARIADRIHDKIEDIDEQLDEYEASDHAFEMQDRQQLALLRRQTATLRRHLAPQRDALDSLVRLPNIINNDVVYVLQDQAERTTRYVEELDLARERAIVLQDELRNRVADQQGIRMYVLSMITAIFLPLSFLTGVFGMNVAGLPGTQAPNAFTVLVIAMVGIAAVMLLVMRRKRWL